jgi:hypothetical protein
MRELTFDKELKTYWANENFTSPHRDLCKRRLDVSMHLDASYALEAVIKELRRRKQFVATMESCSAGRLASILTEGPGASKYFSHGWVTYSEYSKVDAGVPEDLIIEHGVYRLREQKAPTVVLDGGEAALVVGDECDLTAEAHFIA